MDISNKKRIAYTIIVTLIVVFSTTFAILMTLERIDYRNYLQGEYSKNMYELVTSVDNIRSNLTKAAITGSKEQKIMVFEEIFRYSATADDKLYSIPVPQETVQSTGKFLTQVGDFSSSLAKNISQGKDLQSGDYETIEKLKLQSVELETQLNNVLGQINEGKVKWGEIRKKVSGVLAKGAENAVSDRFKDIQKQIAQYPALVYDGPFSDNVQEITPKVNSEKSVTKNQAVDVVKKAVGNNRIDKIESNPNPGEVKIPSYSFYVTIKGRKDKSERVVCEVTQNGGKIVYLLDNKAPGKPAIDVSKAVETGTRYLESMGYKNMRPTYTLNYKNTAVISYIYEQDGVLMYPDQIKLKVALDNGSIVGIESEKYLISHVDKRNIPVPKVTQDKAKERVGKNLSITSIRLAEVPTETNNEALCYEFTGNYRGDNFFVYINAETGYEQRILQIINTPDGQLTM